MLILSSELFNLTDDFVQNIALTLPFSLTIIVSVASHHLALLFRVILAKLLDIVIIKPWHFRV